MRFNPNDYEKEFQAHQLMHKFSSKYLVSEILGIGATSIVTRCVSIKENNHLACKFIFKRSIPLANWKKHRKLGLIPLEIFILDKIDHRNVSTFVDCFEDDTFFYLVMGTLCKNNNNNHLDNNFGEFLSASGGSANQNIPYLLNVPNFYENFDGDEDNCTPHTKLLGIDFSPRKRSPSVNNSITRSLNNRCENSHKYFSSFDISSPASKQLVPLSPPPVLKKSQTLQRSKTRSSLVTKKSSSSDLFEHLSLNLQGESKYFLPEFRIRTLVRQIGDALVYLHKANIIHGDLKLENVLLDDDWNCLLVDFGGAKILTDITQHIPKTNFYGTLVYAPPELHDPTPGVYSPQKVEMWCFGMLIASMITGIQPPLDPATKMLRLSKHVSEELRELIFSLMSVDPDMRMDAAGVLRHRFLASLQVEVEEGVVLKKDGLVGGFNDLRVHTSRVHFDIIKE